MSGVREAQAFICHAAGGYAKYHEFEMNLADGIQESTAANSDSYLQMVELNENLSEGTAATIAGKEATEDLTSALLSFWKSPLSGGSSFGASTAGPGTGFGWTPFPISGGGISGSNYNGLDYVPYDNYVARLHKGERVLTAEEAKGGGGVNVTMNGVTVREDADINRIASELYRLLHQASLLS